MNRDNEVMRQDTSKSTIYSVYLTVLDFNDGRVYQYRIPGVTADDSELTENFINLEGHKASECKWMTHGPTHICGPHLMKEYSS